MTLQEKDYEDALKDIIPFLLEEIDKGRKGEIIVELKSVKKEMALKEREFMDKTDVTIYMTIKPILLKNGIHMELYKHIYLYMRKATEEEMRNRDGIRIS